MPPPKEGPLRDTPEATWVPVLLLPGQRFRLIEWRWFYDFSFFLPGAKGWRPSLFRFSQVVNHGGHRPALTSAICLRASGGRYMGF